MVSRQTVTLANSIVGVSVLAMPFCFKQCGILLATLILMIGAVITRTVCYFLLKAGLITRRRTYEMLAWDTFGQGGKFMVEISIIGFLVGTLIAFFVVMGDLGPEIITEIFDIDNDKSLRIIIMAALGLFVALPLGLLRNIDSLSIVSSASVVFYVFLVCKILSEGIGPLLTGSYLDRIDYWRPAGVMQCIPIFSMALSCQTQIFGIYESLPDPTLQKMNEIVKQAVNICTVFYFCVGFFGYIAFCDQSFGGNILMSFSSSWSTQLIKTCFLMSIVFSVPLVVFPCRASLHSLIFKRVNMHHSLQDASTNYIPEIRLKILTAGIIGFTLVVGILIPNIELVLGLVGSTTGTVICIIFPSIMFIRVTSKQTTERLLAQALFFTGVVMMVVSTYATLYAVDQAANDPLPDQLRVTEVIKAVRMGDELSNINSIHKNADVPEKVLSPAPVKFEKFESKNAAPKHHSILSSSSSTKKPRVNIVEVNDDPPQAPLKIQDSERSQNFKFKESSKVKEVLVPKDNFIKSPARNEFEPQGPPKSDAGKKSLDDTVAAYDVQNKAGKKNDVNVLINDALIVPQQDQSLKVKESFNESPPIQKLVPRIPVVSESSAAPGAVDQNSVNVKKSEGVSKTGEGVEKDVAAVLLKKLEQHEENQKKFLEEQRQVLAELKEHHAQDVQKQQQQEEDQVKVEVKEPKLNLEDKPKQQDNKASVVVVVAKEEVVKQSQIIEKLSENIEKEMQNVKLIEKLEEGLNNEIKKSAEEQSGDLAKTPQKRSSPADPEVKKLVVDKEPLKVAKIDTEPVMSRMKMPEIIPQADKVLLKPIPIQHLNSDHFEKEEDVKNFKNPVNFNAAKAEKVQMPQEEKAAVVPETVAHEALVPAPKVVASEAVAKLTLNKPQTDEDKRDSAPKLKEIVKKSSAAPEPPKKIDRDM